MDIAVILKRVPDTEAEVMVDPANEATILTDDIKWILNPYDEFAVEAAVTLAEEHDGQVCAICIGDDDSEQIIRTAMAMGVTKGILINDEDILDLDIVSQAEIISKVLEDDIPDLIFCGREFIDTNEDAMAAALAEFLDLPHVMNVSQLKMDEDTLMVEREIEGGTLRIELEIPGVLSCQKGLNEPRYPNLMAVRRARKKPLDIINLEEIEIDNPEAGARTLKLYAPPPRAEGQIIEGTPEETAKKAAEWLRDEAKAF